MSVSTECGIMVGRLFEDIVAAGFDRAALEEMLDDGDVVSGSHYYDSSPDENIIGWQVGKTDTYFELDAVQLSSTCKAASEKFLRVFGVQPKTYVTLFVW
jgi:hypothetical protein